MFWLAEVVGQRAGWLAVCRVESNNFHIKEIVTNELLIVVDGKLSVLWSSLMRWGVGGNGDGLPGVWS